MAAAMAVESLQVRAVVEAVQRMVAAAEAPSRLEAVEATRRSA